MPNHQSISEVDLIFLLAAEHGLHDSLTRLTHRIVSLDEAHDRIGEAPMGNDPLRAVRLFVSTSRQLAVAEFQKLIDDAAKRLLWHVEDDVPPPTSS